MLGNWIRQTSTTTGTGNLALSSVSGYAAFSGYFAEGQRFKYCILDDSTGVPIEAGTGYLSSGALVREAIECTMVSGVLDNSTPSAVNLGAGTKRVICTDTMSTVRRNAPSPWSGAPFKVYGDVHTIGSASNITLNVDRAYAIPMSHSFDCEIDALLFRVTTAASVGSLARVGVFSIGADGLPDVKIAESGTIAVNSTGVKTGTFAAFRPPSRYFACLLSDSNAAVQGFGTAVGSDCLGADSVLIPYSYVHQTASAPGVAFPTTWSVTGVLSNATRPQIMARCV